MRLATEPPETFDTEAQAWKMLELFGVDRDQAELERYAVYRLAARIADRWRHGRLLVAGDAAHQMPPFAGQGMCSGIADAANLAWKLDRVLQGADDDLLDSYQQERRPEAQRAIAASVQLGRLICLTDPVAAGHRDRAMAARNGAHAGVDQVRTAPAPADRPAPDGFYHRSADGVPGVAAGHLLAPVRLRGAGADTGLDDRIGIDFTLLVRQSGLLSGGIGDRLRDAGVQTGVILSPADQVTGADCIVDAEGTLTGWLDSIGAVAVLVRPDRYVYGTAADSAELGELVQGLLARLPVRPMVRA